MDTVAATSLEKVIGLALTGNKIGGITILYITDDASVHDIRHDIIDALRDFLHASSIKSREIQSFLLANLEVATGEALTNAHTHRKEEGQAYVVFGQIDDRFVTLIANECFNQNDMQCPSCEELNDQMQEHMRGCHLIKVLLEESSMLYGSDLESFFIFPDMNNAGMAKWALSVGHG